MQPKKEIKILEHYSDFSQFIVIYKPADLPCAPLNEIDTENALFQAEKLFPQIKSVLGKKQIEHGLIHRIDTQTKGLVLIALSQEFYDFIQNEQQNGRFIKTYRAFCDDNVLNGQQLTGFPDFKPAYPDVDSVFLHNYKNFPVKFNVSSFFRGFGKGAKEVRPVTSDSGKAAQKKTGKLKLYSTEINISKTEDNQITALCRISEGFRHQVRNHLAWSGFPVSGDYLYNFKDVQNNSGRPLEFEACGLEFFNPEKQRQEKILL